MQSKRRFRRSYHGLCLAMVWSLWGTGGLFTRPIFAALLGLLLLFPVIPGGQSALASGGTDTITTVAGGWVGDGGAASSAFISTPSSIAADGAGNLYIADYGNHRIRKVDANGVITTVAGTGTAGFSGDGGAATAATLAFPQDVEVDGAGNLYIADYGNSRIRKVDSHGVITTVAGTDTVGFSGDGGAATAAALNYPLGVALDGAGNLYVADTYNSRIRKVDSQGVITTVAGSGSFSFNGDSGAATAAALNYPSGVAVDGAGNLYIADTSNNRIRKVDAQGIVSTVAGTSTFTFNGDGGSATAAALNYPSGVTMDGARNLYIADTGHHRIRKVDSQGVITTVAGNGSAGFGGDGGAAANANLNTPYVVAVDNTGNLFIADSGNFRIRKVDSNGVISTVAGTGIGYFSGDGGKANVAAIAFPLGVTVDRTGNVYIADTINHRIRKVDTNGVIGTVAGTGTAGYSGDVGAATAVALDHPSDVAVDNTNNLYIADTGNSCIRMVTPQGVISTAAGICGSGGFSGDRGPAIKAQLNKPRGVAVDGVGNLYIADSGNHCIRMVTVSPQGLIFAVAGTGGTSGFGGDGGLATNALLNNPWGVAVDSAGSSVYIADSGNSRIRRVDAVKVDSVNTQLFITTLAGNGAADFGGDGGPAPSAVLNNPQGVALDSAGNNLYIADTGNSRIRHVNSKGTITTAAGSGAAGFGGDGGPATAAGLNQPSGIALDGAGNLYIADTNNNRIRMFNGGADLAVTLSAEPNPVQVGNTLTYSVRIVNWGPAPATNVQLTMMLPGGATFLPVHGCSVSGNTLACSLGSMAAGAVWSGTIYARATQVGGINTVASVSANEYDPDSSDNKASAVTTIDDSADLVITLGAQPDPVAVGKTLSYTVNFGNKGPAQATNVRFTVTLPKGVTLQSAPAGCSSSGNTVVCNIGNMAAGSALTGTLGAQPTLLGTIDTVASISAKEPDPDPSNNQASTHNTVIVPSVLPSQSLGGHLSPQAVTAQNITANLGVPVRLDGSKSRDPNPKGVRKPLQYLWSFRYGPGNLLNKGMQTAKPSIILSNPGDYYFDLAVSNANGISYSRVVVHVPAVIQVSAPAAGDSWTLGKSAVVRWKTSGIHPKSSLAVYLSTDGGKTRTVIKQAVPAGRGSFAWKVKGNPGNQAMIEVCLPKSALNEELCGATKGVFSIR